MHSETGQAPAARWIGAGWIPRAPARGEDLDLLLLTAATTRIVQRDGIRFQGTRYISPVLAAYVSETVTIRYDPRDAGEVRVYHQDTYLCRAIAPELAAETVTLQQLQQARGARLADALPTDDRWAPPPAPALDPAEHMPADRAPRHRLRTYATD